MATDTCTSREAEGRGAIQSESEPWSEKFACDAAECLRAKRENRRPRASSSSVRDSLERPGQ